MNKSVQGQTSAVQPQGEVGEPSFKKAIFDSQFVHLILCGCTAPHTCLSALTLSVQSNVAFRVQILTGRSTEMVVEVLSPQMKSKGLLVL